MHEQLYREIEGMQDRLAAWRRVLPELGVGYTQAGRCGLYALLGQGDGTILLCAACGTAVFIFQFVELPIQHRAALAIQISHETRHRYLRWYFLQHVDMVCTYLCFHYPNTFPFA